jgi:hypothetical protein
MTAMRNARAFRRQRGTALLMALVLLFLMSIAALGALRFSSLGVKLGSNEELAVEAFQKAQSVIDATISDPDNVRVQGTVGTRFCSAGVSGCSGLYTIELPGGLFADEIAAGKVTVEVERLAPELSPPPRATGSSLVRFKAARFRIEGVYDEADAGLGRDEADQGVLILVPSG